LDLVAAGAVTYFGFEKMEDNKATLLLQDTTGDGSPESFIIEKSDPLNEMKIIGSEETVERLNHGVDLIIFE
jgi:hypothetical protein